MKIIKKQQEKFLWTLLLFVSLILFIVALNTGNYIFNILTVIMAFLVYRFGYDSMFKEYDEKRKKKREDLLKERKVTKKDE